jgi:hypothetical protein
VDGPPVAGEPAWLPDPTGRHELRWFDGTAFTANVSDGGVTSVEGTDASTANPALPADVTGRKAGKLPVILAAVGAFVVVLALLVLLRDDDGSGGTGEFSGEVTGRHRVRVAAGHAIVVTVDPAGDLDAVVGFEVDDDDLDELGDLYKGTVLADGTEVSDGVVFRADVGFEGEAERTVLAAPFALDATVVVAGFDGDDGEYEVEIEAVDLGLDEDADGDDVIDALREADDVPRQLREALSE